MTGLLNKLPKEVQKNGTKLEDIYTYVVTMDNTQVPTMSDVTQGADFYVQVLTTQHVPLHVREGLNAGLRAILLILTTLPLNDSWIFFG